MTEEVKIPSKEELLEVEEEISTEEGSETDEYSDIEKQAMEMGWSPDGVEGKRNLSAEEFIDRKPLYDDLHTTKKQIKRLQSDIDNITKYQDRIREDERKKVIEELKASKKQALADEDYDKVVEIDEEIASKREEAKKEKDTPKNNAFDQWVSDNKWYHDDSDMRIVADGLGQSYFQQHPEQDLSDVYDYVSKRMREIYPDKFGNTNRSKPASVEGAQRTAIKRNAKSKYSAKDLPEEERQIMRTILRTSKMTEEDYLKEYFSLNS